MILANFVTDFFNGLAVVGFLAFLAIYLVVAVFVMLGRRIKRDTKRQGGIKTVAPKVVAGTAARYAGQILRKRFFG